MNDIKAMKQDLNDIIKNSDKTFQKEINSNLKYIYFDAFSKNFSNESTMLIKVFKNDDIFWIVENGIFIKKVLLNGKYEKFYNEIEAREKFQILKKHNNESI